MRRCTCSKHDGLDVLNYIYFLHIKLVMCISTKYWLYLGDMVTNLQPHNMPTLQSFTPTHFMVVSK